MPHLYLEDTAIAVRHLFDGLGAFRVPLPDLRQYDRDGIFVLPPEVGKENLRLFVRWQAMETARASLAGAVLEVAYQAINILSVNESVPSSCSGLTLGKLGRKFCIGREVAKLPLGLIIFAGRNQYAHWEEGTLGMPLNMQVFSALEREVYHDQNWDLAFTLEAGELKPVSHWILARALGWKEFNDYKRDMLNMLQAQVGE
jgi:hypothetical protein